LPKLKFFRIVKRNTIKNAHVLNIKEVVMLKKRFLLGLMMFTLLITTIYTWPMGFRYMAWQAHPATGSNVALTAEPARAEISTVGTPAQITAAAVPYYPDKYDEEYFYRLAQMSQ
jgi:hypothetical protein